jgi:hypothetical protein
MKQIYLPGAILLALASCPLQKQHILQTAGVAEPTTIFSKFKN